MSHQISDHTLTSPRSQLSRHAGSPPSELSRGRLPSITRDINFGESIDFVVGVTAAALAADQLLKLKDSKNHKTMHLAKAGLSAAAAATAFTMLRREHHEHRRQETTRRGDTQHDTPLANLGRPRSYSSSPSTHYRPRGGHSHSDGRDARSSSQDSAGSPPRRIPHSYGKMDDVLPRPAALSSTRMSRQKQGQ